MLGIRSCALGGLLALAQLAAVQADDIRRAPVAPNWTGAYAGLSLGGRWTDAAWKTVNLGAIQATPTDTPSNPGDYGSVAARFGGYAGVNWQFAPRWLVGLEGDVAWAHGGKTRDGIPGAASPLAPPAAIAQDNTSVTTKWDASLRARVGFLVAPTWLVYATGGAAWQRVEVGLRCFDEMFGGQWCENFGQPTYPQRSEQFTATRTGWTVGGGVETMIADNWLARMDYRFGHFGTLSHRFVADTASSHVNMQVALRTHTVQFGLAYKY